MKICTSISCLVVSMLHGYRAAVTEPLYSTLLILSGPVFFVVVVVVVVFYHRPTQNRKTHSTINEKKRDGLTIKVLLCSLRMNKSCHL